MTGKLALSKTTPDGLFKVLIVSDGWSPEHEHEEVPGESLQQLVEVLEGLARTIRGIAGPVH